MAGSSEPEHSDIPDELLPDGATGSPGQRWWRLQLLGGALLTAIGLPIWVLYFGLDWSTDRIGDVIAEVLLATPVPPSIWFGIALIGLTLPVIATYIHARELSRRGVEVRVWAWPVVAVFCVNTWPLYWLVVWIFYRHRQGVVG
jgi:hypothetical protein